MTAITETRSGEHAREMIDVLKEKYEGGITLMGAGQALGLVDDEEFGFGDNGDSGRASQSGIGAAAAARDEDIDDLENKNLLAVARMAGVRRSRAFSIAELKL